MRRLIWGFAGRTYHIVGNLMHWVRMFEVSLAMFEELTRETIVLKENVEIEYMFGYRY